MAALQSYQLNVQTNKFLINTCQVRIIVEENNTADVFSTEAWMRGGFILCRLIATGKTLFYSASVGLKV